MRFHVLGPLRVTEDDASVVLGGPNQRLVLALLVANIGRAVSTGRLIDGVWGDTPPESARKTLHGNIHRLRAAVGPVIETEQAGYRLAAEPSTIDAVAFEAMVREGRRQIDDNPAAASQTIADALALWYGQPYEDLDGSPALETEIVRLRELRAVAVEDRIDTDLASGPSVHLVAELESLTVEFPLRERLRKLHMLALYQSGRQAEALRVYDATRRHLADELGLDPSAELRRLQEQMLTQDPALEPATAEPDTPRLRSLRGYELRETIGAGALGTVHRAYQTSVGREVALKVIHPHIADDPAFIQRFAEETSRVAALEHPHIVGLVDAWREPGAAYQVLTWLGGGNLRRRLDGDGLTPAAALRLLDQVGAALAYAHRNGVAHCRVKPSNVVFDLDGNPYLTDIALHGTAALRASADEPYVAPELGDDMQPHVPRSDVFSLAVLAHELLTGSAAAGPDAVDDGGRLTAGVASQLRRALQPDPDARHHRVEDLLRGLRQATGIDVSPPANVAAPRSDARNPYKGLRAFQERDAADFFGRDDLIERLRTAIGQRRFVAVVGPSGIGKSSVVKAGLVPLLSATSPESGPAALVTEMFPGAHPFEELETALLRIAVERPSGILDDLTADARGLLRVSKQVLPDDTEAVLVVDQFEELFSLVSDEAVRSRFLDSLTTAVRDDHARIRVIATLRADFYDRPLEYREFGQIFEDGTIPVRMPSEDGLARAIAGPARAVGLDLEPGLVGEIVHDVADQPGGLPLLQYALTELCDQRDSDRMTIEAYRRTGRVLGALGRRAEELWQSLRPPGREAVRQLFLRLVTVDETADDMRRRVRRSELATLDVDQRELDAAITLFGQHRLLSFDRDPVSRGPTVEVAHEALLREWSRLRHWVETHRGELLLHRRLAAAVGDWEAADRDASYLLRGGRLTHFEGWLDATNLTLTRPESAYVQASQAQRDADARRERATARRLRRMLVGVGVLAIVAVLAGAVAALQAGRARDEAQVAVASRESAETRRLALQAAQLVDTNRQVALLLAVEALRRDPTPTTLGALRDVLAQGAGFLGYVAVDAGMREIAYTSDGELIGLRADGIAVVDGRTGEVDRELPATNAHLLQPSPAEGRIAVAEGAAVRLLDLDTGETVADVDPAPGGLITALAFDGDGERLAVGDADGAAAVYDTSTGTLLRTIRDAHPERTMAGIEVPPHQPDLAQFGARAIALSDDGARLATGGLASARVWDVVSGDLLDDVDVTRRSSDGGRVSAPVRSLAFADGGGHILQIASSFNVVERRVGTAVTKPEAEREFPDRIGALGVDALDADVVLSPEQAVLAQLGGRVVVLPIVPGKRAVTFDAQLSGMPSVALAPDGSTAAVRGDEGVSLWSTEGHGLIGRRLPRDGSNEITMSADGRWAVLSGVNARAPALYDVSASPPQRVAFSTHPPSHFGHLGAMDGLLTTDLDGQRVTYRAFDALDGDGLLLSDRLVPTFAYAPQRGLIAFGHGPPNRAVVRVHRLDDGSAVTDDLTDLLPPDPDATPLVLSLSFSPDGRRLLGATTDGAAVIWDTTTWDVVARLSQGGGQVEIAEYSPDGRWLVTTSSDGQTLLRDPDTMQPVGGPLVGQTDGVAGLSHGPGFTADGRYMVTTADGTGRLWDLRERTVVGGGFPSAPGTGPGASADGRLLGTFDDDHVTIWDLDLDAWDDIACRAAGRNLTRSEWDQLGPQGTDYRPTCSRWSTPTDSEETSR